jgi:hypothetical protein
MLSHISEINKKYNSTPKVQERINEANLTYSLHKSEIDKIIQHILIDLCDIDVLGYDKNDDKYWCKKYNNSACIMHLELTVLLNKYDYSDIKISTLIGENNDVSSFISNFDESVQMYKTSNFIRSLLCKY